MLNSRENLSKSRLDFYISSALAKKNGLFIRKNGLLLGKNRLFFELKKLLSQKIRFVMRRFSTGNILKFLTMST